MRIRVGRNNRLTMRHWAERGSPRPVLRYASSSASRNGHDHRVLVTSCRGAELKADGATEVYVRNGTTSTALAVMEIAGYIKARGRGRSLVRAASSRVARFAGAGAVRPTSGRRRSERRAGRLAEEGSDERRAERVALGLAAVLPPASHDTITGHVSLGPVSTVLLRSDVPAFQAACRGFEPRLPLHPRVSCSG